MRIPGSKRENYTQLPHTGVWVPRAEARRLAHDVYRDFSGNPLVSEKLARLSFVAQNDFNPAILDAYLNGEQRKILNIRGYAVEKIPRIALGNLARTAMAANMIEPDVDEDEVSGYIREPFPDKPILGELFLRTRNKQAGSRAKANS